MFKTQNLYQNDKKWKNAKLGNSSETIGGWGGLLTSVTMMLNGIGYNETPETVNEKMKANRGFYQGNLLVPSALQYVWPNCVYGGMSKNLPAPIAQIDAAVAAGKPVILQVDASKETGAQTHFVLVKEKKGDDYVLYDPYKYDGDKPDRDVLLTARYKHNGAKLESEISGVWWFDFRDAALPQPPKATKVPLHPDKFTLYASGDCLALRAEGSADAYVWKLLPVGTKLTCLEPKATAKSRLGQKDNWIHVQDPSGDQGYVAASYVTEKLDFLPTLVPPPPGDTLPSRKKWCLNNVSVENSVFETWDFDDDDRTILHHEPVKSSTIQLDTLMQNTIANVLNPDESVPGWSGITYQETYYDSRVKKWVTTRVTGWVRDADLDDYIEREEEFQKSVVDIPNATKSSTDAAQYMTLAGQPYDPYQVKHNLCGELSVASIVDEKDIDAVLTKWQVYSKESEALYNSTVGKKADEPLERTHMESLFDAVKIDYKRYREAYIPLAAPDGDERRAHADFQKELKDFYFITNLRIDTNTGDLEETDKSIGKERNHWVVVDRITRDGSRVELYNPFPNRREEYTFGEFYKSVGGDPNAGWWIKREVNPTYTREKAAAERVPQPKFEAAPGDGAEFAGGKTAAPSRNEKDISGSLESAFQPPKFEVAIDNRTENPDDAQQYLHIRGEGSKPKTKLCGEFCVTFILGQSMDTALAHWMDHQKELKYRDKQAGLWEQAILLQAYGFNRRKYIKPRQDDSHDPGISYAASKDEQGISSNQEEYFKSFSIDTVLEYWQGVQPYLYSSILGDNRNEPTGPDDLITILNAYGYGKEDYSYYRPGSQEIFGYAPGRDAEALKTHFLIAGVSIHGTTGRLKPTGVAHWVVVTKITPRGNLVGGNGGWVELYNPFPNCWEEYSLREFMVSLTNSFAGSTLWVRKDVHPVFTPQDPSPAKSREKDQDSEKNTKAKEKKKGKPDPRAEAKRKREEEKAKSKKDAKPEKVEDKPSFDADELVRERLGVKGIPREIGRWIRDESDGDKFFAEELTDALVESGILAIQEQVINGKPTRTAVRADPDFSDGTEAAIKKSIDSLAYSEGDRDGAFRVAGAVLPLFIESAINGIKETYRTMPVQAYKGRSELREWTLGLASKLSDPLEAEIKKRIDSLVLAERDQNEASGVASTIVPRFTSRTIDAIKNLQETIPQEKMPERAPKSLPEFVEWARGLACEPRSKVFLVKRWGDAGMSELGFDMEISGMSGKEISSNFQAVGLYNEGTGFGAVSNYIIIPPGEVEKLEALQVEDEYEAKKDDWLHQKMNWMCQHMGSIYMFEDDDFKGDWPWRRPDGIHWGTLALGGNLVQVVDTNNFKVKLPGGAESAEKKRMARLAGFMKSDWDKPLDELLAQGLVHRCYSANAGNAFGDSPKGIVYSPLWSLEGREFRPKPQKGPAPTALWIPVAYLEDPENKLG